MDRRNFIRAVSAAYVSVHLGACTMAGPPLVDEEGRRFLLIVADTILPRTSSPGATDVKADLFVIDFVRNASDEAFAERFFEGMARFKQGVRRKFGIPQPMPTQAWQDHLRSVLASSEDNSDTWFLRQYRRLLLIGWALSPEVAQKAFGYEGHLYGYDPDAISSKIKLGKFFDKEQLPS